MSSVFDSQNGGDAASDSDPVDPEDQLRRHHEIFYNLIQNAPFGVYIVDADFRLAQVSAGAKKAFRNVRPLLGRDFAEVMYILWPDTFANEAISRFRHTLETGEPYAAPSMVEKRADVADVEAYDWRIERVALPDGRFGVVCYFYDLSERQHWEAALREREERFRQVFQNAATGIAITDMNGVLQQGNPAYCAMLGYTEEELQELHFSALVHPDDLTDNAALLDRLRSKEASHFEVENRYVAKDGRNVWVHKFVSVLHDSTGAPAHFVVLVTDTTERRRTEEALRDADRRKDEFLATLAHELRNPLAPIRNAVQVLNLVDPPTPPSQEARNIINRQLQHMVRLIDDLLDVSRITRGKLQLRKERVELAAIAEQAMEAARPHIEDARHELNVSMPPRAVYLQADPARLAQVFSNLLNNAAKYTEPGGRIWFTAARDGDDVLVSIRDTGIGIDAEQLPQLFTMFSQVQSALERSQGGLGVGLSLVRGLVEMHGGGVEAHSDGPGQGSEFVVRLPTTDPGPRASQDFPVVQQPAAARCRILVADDNPDLARILAMLLRTNGHEVQTAHDGQQALEAAAAFRPQLVILDIGMPKLNGYEVAQRIRAQPWGEGMKLIAVTGWGQAEDKRRTKEAGFDRHLTKPVAPELLDQILDGLAPDGNV